MKIIALICALIIPSAYAEDAIRLNTYQAKPEQHTVEIRELMWLNQNFLEKQRTMIDDLVRSKLGHNLHGRLEDIPLLQRLLDKELVKADDKETLQAMGIALGDIFVKENKTLHWMVYQDQHGASHAVCAEKTEACLFPVTMISRRVEGGLKPDIQSVYNKGLADMKPFLPHLPYSD